jgi:hypothetical protein
MNDAEKLKIALAAAKEATTWVEDLLIELDRLNCSHPMKVQQLNGLWDQIETVTTGVPTGIMKGYDASS